MWTPPESNDVIPIHVAARPDLDRALCGAKILPRPTVRQTVELGYIRDDGSLVTLDEAELEAGWLANLPRHPQAVKVGQPCDACFDRVAKLREKRYRPTKKTASRAEAAARREARAQAKAQAKAETQRRREMAKAAREAAWVEQMAEGET